MSSQNPNELDDLLGAIQQAPSERDDRFEVSTLKLTLEWLGMPRQEIAQESRSLGDRFDWDWFNSNQWIEPTLGSGRDHRFSFEGFFTAARRHPVILAAIEFSAPIQGPWIYCFNVYGEGRMAASNILDPTLTHIHVVHPGGVVNIYQYKSLMDRYQNTLGTGE